MSIGALVTSTARNAWALTPFGDGIEPDRTTTRTLLYDRPHARVERIAPRADQTGNPVLLVTPPGVTSACWDLRPGQSLAAHLAGADGSGHGRPTYTIDYGPIGYADRALGFEDWLETLLPPAISRISDVHDGKPVHLVGWSHGGTLALLLAAHDRDLPIASIVAAGTPTDYRRNPTFFALYLMHATFGLGALTDTVSVLGGTTAPLTRLAYRALAPFREITKPWTLASNLHDSEVLARIDAVDGFINAMPGYPARFINQAVMHIICRRELVHGTVTFNDDLAIDVRRMNVPTLFIGSTDDTLTSAASVEAGLTAYPAASVEFLRVKGLSHLGLIASPRSRHATWPAIGQHLFSHDDTETGSRVRSGASTSAASVSVMHDSSRDTAGLTPVRHVNDEDAAVAKRSKRARAGAL